MEGFYLLVSSFKELDYLIHHTVRFQCYPSFLAQLLNSSVAGTHLYTRLERNSVEFSALSEETQNSGHLTIQLPISRTI